MKHSGPELDALLHRLAECPAELYQLPVRAGRLPPGSPPAIDVVAIVADHFRDLDEDDPPPVSVLSGIAAASAAHQKLIGIAVWLLREDELMQQPRLTVAIGRLLLDGLQQLAETIRPELTVTDADRREELVRRCLAHLDLRPAGESVQQAQDRLQTLDSVERVRVVTKTRAAEARARKIREELARKRAQEAAARYSPE